MWLLIDVNESKRITESSRGAVLGRVHEVAQIISPIEKNTKIKTKKLPGAHIYGDASTIWGGVPKLHPTPTPSYRHSLSAAGSLSAHGPRALFLSLQTF